MEEALEEPDLNWKINEGPEGSGHKDEVKVFGGGNGTEEEEDDDDQTEESDEDGELRRPSFRYFDPPARRCEGNYSRTDIFPIYPVSVLRICALFGLRTAQGNLAGASKQSKWCLCEWAICSP